MISSGKVSTIMLVDDNPTDNFINEKIIELAMFADTILIHNSGKSALDFLSNSQDKIHELPDIIFLDINMPVIDGFAFLVEFENFPDALKRKCNIVILSSSDNSFDKNRMNENELVKYFLTKPLSEDSLLEIANLTNK